MGEKIKMSNEIYQAFVNAGFKKEALKLSETIRTKKGPKIRPALGHYIAFLDGFNEFKKTRPYSVVQLKLKDPELLRPQLYNNAKKVIINFLYQNKNSIEPSLSVDGEEALKQFINFYRTQKC